MVAQVQTVPQGRDRHPSPDGWPESPVRPLKRGDIETLFRTAPLHGSALLVYSILLWHADQLGNVHGHITLLSRDARLGVESTRHILRRLSQSGLITVRRRSSGRTTNSWWHIAAVG